MSRPGSVPYLRNRLFRGIPRERLDLERLVPTRLSYPPGAIVFDEGDEPDFCYLIASGAIRITTTLPDGKDELLAVLRPGEFFGELALYDPGPRSARATAAEPTRLGLLDQKSFDHLLDLAPLEMARTLAECAMERVRRTNLLLAAELAVAGRLSEVGGEFGTLSHNLRSPLVTIHSAAAVLKQWVTTEIRDPTQIAHFVEIIQRTADTGLAQIDELMARLRGEARQEPEDVPTEALLRELRELISGLVGAGVRYRDDEIAYRGVVTVERREFLAVLCNLVKNAVEAMPPEGGEVAVAVWEERGGAVFSISDTGKGIPPEHMARLFDRGFTSGKPGGTGLGLSHARSVVRRLGGDMKVKSTFGEGTTVRLHLPLPPPRVTS